MNSFSKISALVLPVLLVSASAMAGGVGRNDSTACEQIAARVDAPEVSVLVNTPEESSNKSSSSTESKPTERLETPSGKGP